MPIGIVLNGLILFQSTEQTLGNAPNAEFHLRLKVSFLVWGRLTMSFAALMIMFGAIADMILLQNRIGEWKNNGATIFRIYSLMLFGPMRIKKRGWNETSRFFISHTPKFKITNPIFNFHSAFPAPFAPRSATKQRSNFSKPYTSPIRKLEKCAHDVHEGVWVWNWGLIQFSPPPIPFSDRECDASSINCSASSTD